jgi:hypothetical protein
MARTTDPVVSETTPGPELTKTEARQGQNVRGMLTVLVVSILLVAAAYAIMLMVSARPDNSAATTPPTAAHVNDPGPAALQQPAPQ